MTVENIFEYATRNKVSFPYKGNVWVEDLWDLSVTELDKVFKKDEIVEVQITIVKHIVAVKLAEKEAKEKAAENKVKKQKIMAIMAARDEKALENASDEDLQKMLSELDG